MFTERENGQMALRRGFSIEPGQRAGGGRCGDYRGSVKEVMEVVEQLGDSGRSRGFADRSNGAVDFGVKQAAVLSLDINSWEAEVCLAGRENCPW